jgi:hypothetical protein
MPKQNYCFDVLKIVALNIKSCYNLLEISIMVEKYTLKVKGCCIEDTGLLSFSAHCFEEGLI